MKTTLLITLILVNIITLQALNSWTRPWPETCNNETNETLLYEYDHIEGSQFVVIGTAGVGAFDETDPNRCQQSFTCNGIFRRETFYYGAKKFVEHAKVKISTLFIDHCYAEFYLQRILNNIFSAKDGTVTLYDKDCRKRELNAAKFRLILSDLSSAITNIVAPFSRLLQAPQLSWGGASNWFDDLEKYPLLLRYLSSNRYEAHFIIKVCQMLKVDKIVLLYAETDYGLSGAQRIRKEAKDACICIKKEHMITRNVSLFELKKISASAWEDPDLKVVVWMGEEGYIMNLINDLPPREGMKKIFVSGLTWIPATYPGSIVDKISDGYKCITNRRDPKHIEEMTDWYKKVKGTVSVGMVTHSNPFNGDLCNLFGNASEICEETKIETTDGFIINMMSAWRTAWEALRHNKSLHKHQYYKEFYEAMKIEGRFYNNHAPADYDIYRITCDREKPAMTALTGADIRGNTLRSPTNCYTFDLVGCVDWIKEIDNCSNKKLKCDEEKNLEAQLVAWGIIAIAAALFFIVFTTFGVLCFTFCTSKCRRKSNRMRKSGAAQTYHDNNGFQNDIQEENEGESIPMRIRTRQDGGSLYRTQGHRNTDSDYGSYRDSFRPTGSTPGPIMVDSQPPVTPSQSEIDGGVQHIELTQRRQPVEVSLPSLLHGYGGSISTFDGVSAEFGSISTFNPSGPHTLVTNNGSNRTLNSSTSVSRRPIRRPHSNDTIVDVEADL